MDNPIITVLITTVGYFFWLWSRGGGFVVKSQNINKMDQTIHTPAASPLLSIFAIVLIPLGLYLSFQESLLIFIISLVVAPVLAWLIFRPFWSRINRN